MTEVQVQNNSSTAWQGSQAGSIQSSRPDSPVASLPQKNTVVSIEVYELMRNADVLIKSGESRLALNLLRVASSKDSKSVIVLNRLAKALEDCAKFDESIVVWRNLKKIAPSFESSFGFAQCLYKLEKDDEALQAYFECMAQVLTPLNELFEVYKNVGNIFVKQGDYDAAEEYFNKAFCINRNSDVLLVNIATLEFQRNDLEKSIYGFRRALEINHRNDKAWVGLALLHKKMGDPDLSLANLERAVDINPANRTALLLYAAWAETSDQKTRAAEFIQEYLASETFDSDMSLVLIQMLCQVHQESNAEIEVFRSFLQDPTNAKIARLFQELKGCHA